MTNIEKHKEVFGFYPKTSRCPSEFCYECPLKDHSRERNCSTIKISEWWNSEYEESKAKVVCDECYKEVIPNKLVGMKGDKDIED